MLSWHWYTAAAGGIQARDLTIAGPTLDHTTATGAPLLLLNGSSRRANDNEKRKTIDFSPL